MIDKEKYLCLEKDLVQEAGNRLLFALQHDCRQENIKIEFCNSIFELNDTTETHFIEEEGKKIYLKSNGGIVEEDKLASGKYIYYQNMMWEKQHLIGYPIIRFLNKSFDIYNIFTFAHEVGHHFCVKYHDDGSEKGADNYIEKLCQRLLSKRDQAILRLHIEIRKNS